MIYGSENLFIYLKIKIMVSCLICAPSSSVDPLLNFNNHTINSAGVINRPQLHDNSRVVPPILSYPATRCPPRRRRAPLTRRVAARVSWTRHVIWIRCGWWSVSCQRHQWRSTDTVSCTRGNWASTGLRSRLTFRLFAQALCKLRRGRGLASMSDGLSVSNIKSQIRSADFLPYYSEVATDVIWPPDHTAARRSIKASLTWRRRLVFLSWCYIQIILVANGRREPVKLNDGISKRSQQTPNIKSQIRSAWSTDFIALHFIINCQPI